MAIPLKLGGISKLHLIEILPQAEKQALVINYSSTQNAGQPVREKRKLVKKGCHCMV